MRADARAGLLGTPAPRPHAASLTACGGLSALGTSPVYRVCNPREVLVRPDRGVVAVHEDDLVVFQLPVLSYPVGVEDFHVREFLGCTFLGNPLDALAGGEPVLAHACGAACADVPGCPAAATAYLHAGNRDTL